MFSVYFKFKKKKGLENLYYGSQFEKVMAKMAENRVSINFRRDLQNIRNLKDNFESIKF